MNSLVLEGFGIETISKIMNDTFQTSIFTIPYIRQFPGNPMMSNEPFTREEARKLIPLFSEQVLKKNGYICKI